MSVLRAACLSVTVLVGCNAGQPEATVSPDASPTVPEADAAPSTLDATSCPYIIGGQPDTGDSAVGAIVLRTSSTSAWHVDCTGTLIAPSFVLTAAHCVSPQVLGNVQLGFALGTNLTSVNGSQVYLESHRYPHPSFTAQQPANGLADNVYDIAVLELAQPVTSVSPAKLGRTADDALIHSGTSVRIVGYGVTSNNGQDIGTKRIATTHLGTVASAEMIVGVPGEPQKCNGDSGGPTFLDVSENCATTARVIGTTSRPANQQLNCQEPGIDSRTSFHLQWLGTIVPFSCDSGTNTTPCS